VTQDDLLYRFRLRTFAMAVELGNVRAACRAMGIHPSTYYRWKRQLDRYGPEILRPREPRVPRMANQTSVLVEQRVVAFALGHPGFGPARIAAELARPKWGGILLSTNGVWRVLRRHGLSTRAKRYGLVAGYAAPPEPQRPQPTPERHLQVDHPGKLVQLDCFCIGRLSGTKGQFATAGGDLHLRMRAEVQVLPGPPHRALTSRNSAVRGISPVGWVDPAGAPAGYPVPPGLSCRAGVLPGSDLRFG
jgi:transposase